MSQYRHALPVLDNRLFMTDGGLETTLIFHEHLELPLFSAIDLLRTEAGTQVLYQYYCKFAELARQRKLGLLLESASWRASPDWGQKLGYDQATLAALNRRSIEVMVRVRNQYETTASPVVISGVLGPRGDGYRPDKRMTAPEATTYHSWQIRVFADTEADLVAAYTLNYLEEALGIVEAARQAQMPVAISFTVETDGRLPTGQTQREAIEQVDHSSNRYPAYYMVNCAHPTHFEQALKDSGDWLQRLRGIRANASKHSHAELDNSTELDMGNPRELAQEYRELRQQFPQLTIIGGCCGTDYRHIAAICEALTTKREEAVGA